jgi:hypothetical protein
LAIAIATRRDDDAHVVSLAPGLDDALGNPLDALSVSDRRTAVLLDDNAHAVLLESGSRW